MNEPPNFILVPAGNSPVPEVDSPEFMERFLDLFEDYCVVACCDWSAINLSEEHIRKLASSSRSTLEATRTLIQAMREWAEGLTEPSLVRGSLWWFDPKDAVEALSEALATLDHINESPRP